MNNNFSFYSRYGIFSINNFQKLSPFHQTVDFYFAFHSTGVHSVTLLLSLVLALLKRTHE